jgi:hypothetical protein
VDYYREKAREITSVAWRSRSVEVGLELFQVAELFARTADRMERRIKAAADQKLVNLASQRGTFHRDNTSCQDCRYQRAETKEEPADQIPHQRPTETSTLTAQPATGIDGKLVPAPVRSGSDDRSRRQSTDRRVMLFTGSSCFALVPGNSTLRTCAITFGSTCCSARVESDFHRDPRMQACAGRR